MDKTEHFYYNFRIWLSDYPTEKKKRNDLEITITQILRRPNLSVAQKYDTTLI